MLSPMLILLEEPSTKIIWDSSAVSTLKSTSAPVSLIVTAPSREVLLLTVKDPVVDSVFPKVAAPTKCTPLDPDTTPLI